MSEYYEQPAYGLEAYHQLPVTRETADYIYLKKRHNKGSWRIPKADLEDGGVHRRDYRAFHKDLDVSGLHETRFGLRTWGAAVELLSANVARARDIATRFFGPDLNPESLGRPFDVAMPNGTFDAINVPESVAKEIERSAAEVLMSRYGTYDAAKRAFDGLSGDALAAVAAETYLPLSQSCKQVITARGVFRYLEHAAEFDIEGLEYWHELLAWRQSVIGN